MTQDNRQRLGRAEARDKLLRAAARVFVDKGRAATVEDIAVEAEYSASALYKHFSNKDDLFRCLWHRVFAEMIDVFTSEPPMELPFEGRLKWTLYSIAEFAENDRDLFLAAMANAPLGESPMTLEEEFLEKHNQMRDAFHQLMVRGIEQGVLRDYDPATLAMALGGHLQALTGHWALEGPFPLKPHMDDVVELFLHGAAAGSD